MKRIRDVLKLKNQHYRSIVLLTTLTFMFSVCFKLQFLIKLWIQTKFSKSHFHFLQSFWTMVTNLQQFFNALVKSEFLNTFFIRFMMKMNCFSFEENCFVI